MVILPILAANALEIYKGDFTQNGDTGLLPIIVGFVAAFIAGLLACKWMIRIVQRGNLFYFALYCFIIGLIAIVFG